MRNFNNTYWIDGLKHLFTFESVSEARRHAKHLLKKDHHTHEINGAGRKIVRYNCNNGKYAYFNI